MGRAGRHMRVAETLVGECHRILLPPPTPEFDGTRWGPGHLRVRPAAPSPPPKLPAQGEGQLLVGQNDGIAYEPLGGHKGGAFRRGVSGLDPEGG